MLSATVFARRAGRAGGDVLYLLCLLEMMELPEVMRCVLGTRSVCSVRGVEISIVAVS